MKDEIFRTSLHTSYNPTGSPMPAARQGRTGMPMANATAECFAHAKGERRTAHLSAERPVRNTVNAVAVSSGNPFG
ncbi:MAG: hypothetical protein F6K28_50510 [Microcoleus sp. SIO2G3]|nr:hypothetical protein [Microcoleus sp. SIO2G3]